MTLQKFTTLAARVEGWIAVFNRRLKESAQAIGKAARLIGRGD